MKNLTYVWTILLKNYTSSIVLENCCITAKYQPPLVQNGQKIPVGLDLKTGVPVKKKLSVYLKYTKSPSRSKFTTRTHACIKSRSVKVEISQNYFIVSGWAVGRFKQVRQ